jgi:hypothetical protein
MLSFMRRKESAATHTITKSKAANLELKPTNQITRRAERGDPIIKNVIVRKDRSGAYKNIRNIKCRSNDDTVEVRPTSSSPVMTNQTDSKE